MNFSAMNSRMIFFCIGLVLLLVIPSYSDVVVFGDSLSDTGNTYRATLGIIPNPSNGYFQGRFTNGNVWIENLATSLGQPAPTPSRDPGGLNFAHGGSKVLDSGFLRPNLLEQVADLGVADPTDLHVIWAGGNDLLSVDLDLSADDQILRAQQVAAGINLGVDELYLNGARQFLVLNLPQLGSIPLSSATLSSENILDLNNVSDVFNRELAEEMVKARADNADINIFEFDVQALFNDVIADPASFGLVNVTDSATPFDSVGGPLFPAGLATSPPLPGVDPQDFLYYDGLHPTARAHEILATEIALAMSVPEPSPFLILALGLSVCLVVRCNRRQVS